MAPVRQKGAKMIAKGGVLLGLALSLAATEAAAIAPVWERFPHLVCRTEAQVSCFEETCSTSPLTGLWDLNFRTSTLTYLSGSGTEKMVGLNQNTAGETASIDTVLLSSSRMLTFVNMDGVAANEMKATLVGVFQNTRTISLTCAEPA